MIEELTKEIEQAKFLGRSARRKKERELQKKYNNKSIRILSNKTFTKGEALNHDQRRELVKDKNLFLEVVKIIKKYIPQLNRLINELTDKRNKSYITYSMKTILYTKLFVLICGITTMTEISDGNNFSTEEAVEKLSNFCEEKFKNLPDWQTIQDVIEQLDIEEIENIRKNIVKGLIRSKMFYKYRYNDKYYQLLVDATGVSSHDYNLNGTCIIKKSKTGVLKYYKYALEAKLVFGDIVISLDTEWIENSQIKNENEKQDCEINAFKRMAPRIKKNFPKMKFIITGDALYATEPIISLCNSKEYKWKYILNLKKDRLKNLYNDFEDDLNYENETNKENYFLSSKLKYKMHKLSAVKYQEQQQNKLVTFNYITNLVVTNNNIEEIVKLGRARWKIENEGFREQKNGTFKISHLCSRNENAIKIHYYLIQIAHIIRQLLEKGSKVLRDMKLKTKKEVSKFIIKCFTSKTTTSDLNHDIPNFQLRFNDD